MPILHSPCGQPVSCPQSRVNDLLAQGYRAQRDAETAPEAALLATTALTGVVDLNSATLKEMADLPGVGTAIAKKVREGRPYRFVEDLIEQIPDVPWLSLRDRIALNKPQAVPEDRTAEVPDGINA